jgi:hypothetical protein
MALVPEHGGDPQAIPHEPGAWMKFRALSWDELREAEKVRTRERREALAGVGSMIDMSSAQQLIEQMTPEQLEAFNSDAKTPAADRSAYDRGVVLEHGITEWSYDEPTRVEVPVTPDTPTGWKYNARRLDPKTADWAFEEIMRLTLPWTADEGEA